jgi:hypothetical protein
MLKGRDLKYAAIGAVVASGLSVLAAVNIPNTFTAGTPIRAEEVNANFSSLKAALEALQAGSGSVADGTITSSKLATQNTVSSGKFLAFNGSSLVWADGTAGTPGPQGPIGSKGDVGATGAQGANGVSGYERLVTTLTFFTLPKGNEVVYTLTCPAGKKLVGGGFTVIGESGTFSSTKNGPRNDVEWEVGLYNANSVDIRANAIFISAICVTTM